MTLSDFIYRTYNNLLESGWRMNDIDGMDMLGYLRVKAWNAKHKKKEAEPKQTTIDQVWPGLKP